MRCYQAENNRIVSLIEFVLGIIAQEVAKPSIQKYSYE
jgi:hypothetical protein